MDEGPGDSRGIWPGWMHREVGLAEGWESGAGSTDLSRVGRPGVDSPEQLAARNDLHSVLNLRHGIHHVAISLLGAIVLKQNPRQVSPWPSYSRSCARTEHSSRAE